MMEYKTATVFGGTGFIGRHIVRGLAREGYLVRVVTRIPESAYFLKPSGMVGQIVPITCDFDNPASIDRAIEGSQAVVYSIGTLVEKGKAGFKRLHVDMPRAVAESASRCDVERLVLISALGIAENQSDYARSKREGEDAVRAAFPNATILRPSVVFGPDDRFFNRFASMARIMPFMPLIGGGGTRFQPVYVGDVAEAAVTVIKLPHAVPETSPLGRAYDLGGPEVLTLRDVYLRVFRFTHRSRPMLRVPFWLASLQAAFLGLLPNAPLTRDQVKSLKSDSVVKGADGFAALNIIPAGLDFILSGYLDKYRIGGRFGDKEGIAK